MNNGGFGNNVVVENRITHDVEEGLSIKTYTNKLMFAVKKSAEALSEIITLVKNAPPECISDECFQLGLETSVSLMGLQMPTPSQPDEPLSQRMSQCLARKYFEDDEWYQAAVKAVEIMESKGELLAYVRDQANMKEDQGSAFCSREDNDVPSFSLGISQVDEQYIQDDDDFVSKGDEVSNEYVDVTDPVMLGAKEHVITRKRKQRTYFTGSVGDVQMHDNVSTTDKNLRQNRKKSSTLVSPYAERATGTAYRFTREEKEVMAWILQIGDSEDFGTVYNNGGMELIKIDVASMRPTKLVTAGIVNAWSYHLQKMEQNRAPGSTRRYFFTTFPVSYRIITKPPKLISEEDKSKAFVQHIRDESFHVIGNKWDTVDLVFFPVCHNEHFYAIVIDFKKNTVLIIDNSNACDDDPLRVKYETVPFELVRRFCEYLNATGFHIKAAKLAASRIERMKMPWRNNINKVDCAIYLMRHMETFMGQEISKWECGFTNRGQKILDVLRARYCNLLIRSEWNKCLSDVMQEIAIVASAGCGDVDKTWFAK